MRSARRADSADPDGDRFQVVGIVGDVKNDGLGKPTVAEVYLPSAVTRVETMNVVMRRERAAGDARAGGRGRRFAASIPNSRFTTSRRCRDIVRRSMTLERVASYLTTFFARDGGGDGDARHLRRVVVRRAPADRRDRHPHGARRDQPRHPDAHRRWGSEDGRFMASLAGIAVAVVAALSSGTRV